MRLPLPLLLMSLVGLSVPLAAQTPDFTRGVNLTEWFQGASIDQAPLNRYTRADMEDLRRLGVDVIRLPLDLHFFTLPGPGHTLAPVLFRFLDPVVQWAEELGFTLVLDNHSFDTKNPTPPAVEETLTAVWLQVAARYSGKGDFLLYEILNEPHGIDLARWGQIEFRVLQKIRTVDARHRIVVGGGDWNSLDALKTLPDFHDARIVYTFHFYDPFLFTHQGANWPNPSLAPLAGVPFPYDRARMPAVPAALAKTWVESGLRDYPAVSDPAVLEKSLKKAFDFRNQTHLPVFCGEFGVYNVNADPADRARWYRTVTNLLDKFEIPHTSWDCRGTFGIFKKNSEERFESDLDLGVVEAMGLHPLVQVPGRTGPETGEQLLFSGLPGRGVKLEAWGQGVEWKAFDEASLPGSSVLTFRNLPRYGNVRFTFLHPRDLSVLAGGADLVVRVKPFPGFEQVEIRFLSIRKDDPSQIAWRMAATLDLKRLKGTDWQEVRIPLKEFHETGAWKDRWFDAKGLFDWSQVTLLEMVAENVPLSGTGLSVATLTMQPEQ